MAVLSALRRFARLGFWVGLGAGAMLVDACGSSFRGETRDSAELPTNQDDAAVPDAGADAQVDAQPVDAEQVSVPDGGLWDTICE
jgi:hypothetical protein